MERVIKDASRILDFEKSRVQHYYVRQGVECIGIVYDYSRIFGYLFEGITMVEDKSVLTTTIDIPSSVRFIWDPIFDNCPGLEAINVEQGEFAPEKGFFYGKMDIGNYNKYGKFISCYKDLECRYISRKGVLFQERRRLINGKYVTSFNLIRVPMGYKGMLDLSFSDKIIMPSEAIKGCNKLTSLKMSRSKFDAMQKNSIGRNFFVELAYYCPNLKIIFCDAEKDEFPIENILPDKACITVDDVVRCEWFNEEIFFTRKHIVWNEKKFIQSDVIYEFKSNIKRFEDKFTLVGVNNANTIESLNLSIDFVSKIERKAFENYKNINSIYIRGIKSIEDSTFCGCSGLTKLNIGNGVKYIRDKAFCGCYSLTDLEIGESVEYIGKYSFSGCTSLKSIVIPPSVRQIDQYAFLDCPNVDLIKCMITDLDKVTIADEAFSKCGSNECILQIPENMDEEYKRHRIFSKFRLEDKYRTYGPYGLKL